MRTVAVTGAAGHLGRAVCEALEEQPDVRRVVGIDVTEPEWSTRNLEFYALDVRSPAIVDVIAGCDALVHLAFVIAPQRDEVEMREVNVEGTRSVLDAAAAAGISRIVYRSSVMVYGAHADNDFPLTEESPIRPVEDFSYSAHKAECEQIVAAFREQHPDARIAVMRPSVVLGPRVGGIVARTTVESPVAVGVAGYDPPVQFVHEADAAAAIVHALVSELDGAYNVCPDDWIEASEARRIRTEGQPLRTTATVDASEARRRLGRMWELGIGELPPSFLPFLMYPWVMSNEKLRETGFSFRYGSRDALRDAVEAHRGWVSVGRVRFRPRRVLAAGIGVALLGASVARRATRSRTGKG